MKKTIDQTLINYAKAQTPKEQSVKPFNPDNYQWQAKGTRWKQVAVVMLSPLSCILVWVYLAFLSSK